MPFKIKARSTIFKEASPGLYAGLKLFKSGYNLPPSFDSMKKTVE